MKLLYGIPAIGIATILNSASAAEDPNLCVEGGFSIVINGECNAVNFLSAYSRLYAASPCNHTVDEDLRLKLGLATTATEDEVEAAVKAICVTAWDDAEKIPFDYTHLQGEQFEQMYYNGGTYWNEEVETYLESETGARTNHLKTDASVVNKFYKSFGQISHVEWPGYLPNFDLSTCEINAAMCCWPQDRQANDGNGNCATPYDQNCYDKDPADNTDLCFVDLSRSPEGNKMESTGLVNFPHDGKYGEGSIHCHGFAWANDDYDFTSRYKANNLFYVSMYDHMHQRGYVRNIPGAPMCACVEQMPTVTRSDCTQIDVDEIYKIEYNPETGDFRADLTDIEIDFNACQGRYNRNNDLHAYVARLVQEGKLNNDQRAALDKYLVYNNRCQQAMDYQVETQMGKTRGYEYDETVWFGVAGSNSLYVEYIGREGFRDLFAESPNPIVWRVCATCVPSHQHIYYKRITPIPDDFDLYYTLLDNWVETPYNLRDVDFKLYSTYEDALNDRDPWTFYSFRSDRGFPYESGPTEKVSNQWRRFRDGQGQTDVAFYVMKSTSPETERITRCSDCGSLTSVDIGPPSRTDGGVLEKEGTYYITAAGSDIWGTWDQFLFLQEEKANNDMTLKVYVSHYHKRDSWTKSGLMIRDTLDANSAHFHCLVTDGKGVVANWRPAAGSSSSHGGYESGLTFEPIWLMLTKRGDDYTCFSSADGQNWWPANHPVTISMGASVHTGMALTSHNTGKLAEVVFEQYENTLFSFPSASPSVSSAPSETRPDLADGKVKPLELCEGDCNEDADCAGDLVCFDRSGLENVPGCAGDGVSGRDYCIEQTFVLRGSQGSPTHSLGLCEGDCDKDADCAGDLVCYHISGYDSAPGCEGTSRKDFDYCIEQTGILRGVAGNPGHILGRCEGDCDGDANCADGLVCFQRSALTPVPGCEGYGLTNYDYCIDPADASV